MSNGGYMSFFTWPVSLSDKIAAIASVTGSMTPQTYTVLVILLTPLPYLQIHGTMQMGLCLMKGDPTWTYSIEDVMSLLGGHTTIAILLRPLNSIPDISIQNDGSTVDHFIYDGGR